MNTRDPNTPPPAEKKLVPFGGYFTQFAQWLRDCTGAPNSYCSGNVFDLPVGRTVEEEVTLRRLLARQVVAILTQADAMKGTERTAFVKDRMEALQQEVLARRHA